MNVLLLAILLFFSFMATEGIVEYVLGTLFDKVAKLTPYKWALMYVSLLLGLFFAFAFNLDLVQDVFGIASASVPPLGIIITGVVIGRGANFVSDIWNKFLSK